MSKGDWLIPDSEQQELLKDPVLMLEYEAVRRSGVTNMLDLTNVRSIAEQLGLSKLEKMSRAPQSYSKLLMAYTEPDEVTFQAWLRTKRKERDVLDAINQENA